MNQSRTIPLLVALAALCLVVLTFAAPVSLQVDDTTGEVLSPLIADATSNKTIAVFYIPMGDEMWVSTDSSETYDTQAFPRDFELKIYKQATSAAVTSTAIGAKVYWFHGPNKNLSGQVLPTGVPDGYYLGSDAGGVTENKENRKIDYTGHTSLSAQESASYLFTGYYLYVETAGTTFELMADCYPMYNRYSATGTEGSQGNGRKWTPCRPVEWVSELPTFLE